MPRPQQFQRIATRYLEVAQLTSAPVPEASAFCSYHAFESIGCAWIRSRGHPVTRRSSHISKINLFVTLSRGETFRIGVARLGIVLNSLRNKMLYPVPNGVGTFDLPERHMNARDAADLLRRVRGIVAAVDRRLP